MHHIAKRANWVSRTFTLGRANDYDFPSCNGDSHIRAFKETSYRHIHLMALQRCLRTNEKQKCERLCRLPCPREPCSFSRIARAAFPKTRRNKGFEQVSVGEGGFEDGFAKPL